MVARDERHPREGSPGTSDLFAPGCSIAMTRRRRFFWAAWWTAAPHRRPFRPPDASEGGARTFEEAFAAAERAAGMPLAALDSSWAKAWLRVIRGQPPFGSTEARGRATEFGAEARRRPVTPHPTAARSVWDVLGLPGRATEAEIKQAHRRRVLETHPDRGGDAAEFREVQRAYVEALRRAQKPSKRSR